MGDAAALRDLELPECPVEVEYLVDFARGLIGRSGVGFGGANPLSYGELEAWCRLTGTRLDPMEVEAVMLLDAVYRDPEAFADEEEGEPEDAFQAPAWPARKPSPEAEPTEI